MSNPYFRFKQFEVLQERCAMKVTTDACIQGAWTQLEPGVKRVLDIGAGTALLSLMLAQRNPDIIIDAIELDSDAAGEGRGNAMRSSWGSRINVLKGDVRYYSFEHKYDFIISNPPFFTDSLLGKEARENIAYHTRSLSHAELLIAIDARLEEDGYFSILLPVAEYELWLKLTKAKHWFEINRLSVRHKKEAIVKRVVGIFCRKEGPVVQHDELIIMDDSNNYSRDFIDLLSPFYLNL